MKFFYKLNNKYNYLSNINHLFVKICLTKLYKFFKKSFVFISKLFILVIINFIEVINEFT